MSKSKKTKNQSYFKSLPWPKIVILIVIGISFLTVIAAVIYSVMYSPEKIIHAEVKALAKDYYENYVYKDIEDSGSTPAKALEPYREHGLTPVKLRQILLSDEERNIKVTALIEEYCNTTQTTVRFYPDPPYGKTDYHVSYVYSCNF